MSFDVLQEKIFKLENPTVAGLDPRPEYVPEHIMHRHFEEKGQTLQAVADAYFEFNKGLIDALCDIVPALKPQSAYYEMLGYAGIETLKKTLDYGKSKGMYVIADIKRNDIGSTAQAYSEAYLGTINIGGVEVEPFGFDSVTVNPYLGRDGIEPFVETCKSRNKTIFALVKTSNPSSADLQDLEINGEKMYAKVGQLLEMLCEGNYGKYGYSCVGAVVGATYPEELKLLRGKLKHTFFLVPGYGTQGGGAKDAANAFDSNGCGAIINSSRAIICAWKKTGNKGADYMEAARNEALRMREDLRSVIKMGK